jgi:hypothetical protein
VANETRHPAGRAQIEITQLFYGERYEEVWQRLHPGQRRLIERDDFVECEQSFGHFAALLSVRAKAVKPTTIRGVGLPPRTRSMTVTLEIRDARDRYTDTYETVRVNGSWHWLMRDAEVRLYARGECPPPPEPPD